MSNHAVEVVPVVLETHPNAHSLSIVRIRGFTVCVRTIDWKDGMLGAYIPPDSLVDIRRPEFAFLKDPDSERVFERIKVKKLRGVVSMGLLIPAPPGSKIGDDVASLLGVEHYEPPLPMESGGEDELPPKDIYVPHFDVENLRRYPDVFVPGEPVEVTEKCHGGQGRFVFWNDRLWAGSRTAWKKPADPAELAKSQPPRKVLWWAALEAMPGVSEWLKANPGKVVYGEVYGQVQDLKYGIRSGARIACFDVFDATAGKWWDAGMAADTGLPWVPRIASNMPFDMSAIIALAEGPTLFPGADHVREGCVIRPMKERFHEEIGRTILKVAGNGYMERA